VALWRTSPAEPPGPVSAAGVTNGVAGAAFATPATVVTCSGYIRPYVSP
jgi:hypothetical protein